MQDLATVGLVISGKMAMENSSVVLQYQQSPYSGHSHEPGSVRAWGSYQSGREGKPLCATGVGLSTDLAVLFFELLAWQLPASTGMGMFGDSSWLSPQNIPYSPGGSAR